ncbi:hypothetical protein JW826_00715 [Candidatus Woesearchaeota archaeon]|nr:hypothetical protein [Candidatus Woesearchaeota archaeon]
MDSRLFALGLFMLLSGAPVSGAVLISEIMYNPMGNDNNLEFIEVLGTDDLTSYVFGDSSSNDSLETLKFVPGNFSLIVEEGFDHSGINASVFSAGATIGNNLNNDADEVFLYLGSVVAASAGYDGGLANGNGYSLELVNGEWLESCVVGGSPGSENCAEEPPLEEDEGDLEEDEEGDEAGEDEEHPDVNASSPAVKLEIVLPDEIYLGLIYDSLFKVTNLNHTSGVESFLNVTVFYNVTRDGELVVEGVFSKIINAYSASRTGELFVDSLGSYTLCGWTMDLKAACKTVNATDPSMVPCFVELGLALDKERYEDGDRVRIKNSLVSWSVNHSGAGDDRVVLGDETEEFPFLIEYWVEDLFGDEAKKRVSTANTAEKSWTPRIDERDRVFVAHNRLVFVACNNSNSKVSNEVLFIVRNPGWKPVKASLVKNVTAQKHGQISSFYTRTRNWRETISLYANVKGSGSMTALLRSKEKDIARAVNESEKFSVEAPAEPGKNLYLLELYEKDKLVDAKSLVVELKGGPAQNESGEPEEVVLENKSFGASEEVLFAKGVLESNDNKSLASAGEPFEEVTGDVLYESSGAKLSGMTGYFSVAAVILVILGLFFMKKNNTTEDHSVVVKKKKDS